MIDVSEVGAALDAAGEAGDNRITVSGIGNPIHSSKRRRALALAIIKRFVEAIPEGTTVDELREHLDTIDNVETPSS